MLSNFLACCVDKKQLKEESINYLKGRKSLAMDVVVLLDYGKIYIMIRVSMN